MELFDIIGPVMVGPSSSHTAGAVRIGYAAGKLLGEKVKDARILLYGSFLDTGKGHGTDRALLGKVMERAVKMGESNACMKRIVAAPTAGSCGVIPAVLLSYEEYGKVPEDELINALYVAAGIGKVIGENASIAGASGGCQAEIGTASAMAAGALAYLQGGDNETIANAMALALKNMLGIACDPVGGLVEVPCVKRNSHGAVNAVASAQMALAGVRSAISPDDVIDSMRRIGNEMPASLKETGKGGLATSESARRICGGMSRSV